MPVRRFRTLEEWNDASVDWGRGGDFKTFCEHNAFVRRLSSATYPQWLRGVHKFRTIEDAQRAREAWRTGARKESR